MKRTIISVISLVWLGALVGCSKQPTPLDAKLVDTADPAEVASKAFLSITNAESKAASLPDHWRLVYRTMTLDGEVNNGGFHQFFWNSEGRWNKETEKDLATIGAEPFLKLFRDARKIFDAHDYPAEKAKAAGSWEAFTVGYQEKRMGDLDTAFANERKSFPSFVGEYVKRNRKLYEKR